jgi:hypothetical protein
MENIQIVGIFIKGISNMHRGSIPERIEIFLFAAQSVQRLGYGLEGGGVGVRFPVEERDFLNFITSRPCLWSTAS